MNVDIAQVMTWAVYAACAYLILLWLDILRNLLGMRAAAIPVEVDLGSRDAVKHFTANVKGFSSVPARVRSLLEAWSVGWNARAVVGLASAQSARDNNRLRVTGLFLLLLFAAGIKLSNEETLAWIGIAATGVTLLAKGLLYSRIDTVIEKNLLCRLPANIPATAMTASELAAALGGAIESAFKNYIPQPERMASAITKAVDSVGKASSGDVEALHKKLIESQSALLDKWTSHEKSTMSTLEAARKALDTVATQLSSGLQSSSEKFQSALASHVQHLEKAGQVIASQLDKIMALEKDIQQVLHVQQVTDGTLKSLSASEEFKQTLAALRNHLAESDKLLREVGKPRTIRLIESEQEVSHG